MRKAWKVENVVIKHIEADLLSFTFFEVEDKKTILENGPWSFSSNLLLMKNWEEGMPLHHYKFTNCEFWMHVSVYLSNG